MENARPTRRRVLVTGSGVTLAALAGCTGSDDDGEESGDDGSEDRTLAWDTDVPDDPAFLANPDVEGPGGDASYVLTTTIPSRGETDDYDRFEIEIERVILHAADGDDVTVPIEVTVDLAAYETGPAGDTITLAWDLAIPSGTYTSISLETSAVELIHGDEGDVTDVFEAPPTAEFASDDGTEVTAESSLRTELNLYLVYDMIHPGTATFEQSLSVGTATGDVIVFDLEYYEND